jgi:hypothetical protein
MGKSQAEKHAHVDFFDQSAIWISGEHITMEPCRMLGPTVQAARLNDLQNKFDSWRANVLAILLA